MIFAEPVREDFRTSSRTGPAGRTMRRTTQPCAVLHVDPKVWGTALRLAAGDALRIEVITEREVVVRNGRRRNTKGTP